VLYRVTVSERYEDIVEKKDGELDSEKGYTTNAFLLWTISYFQPWCPNFVLIDVHRKICGEPDDQQKQREQDDSGNRSLGITGREL